jgi:hypothetical protein
MGVGDFDAFDHFGHDRMNHKDGYPGSVKSERRTLRIVFFLLWFAFAIGLPYLDYGYIDWLFAGFVSIGCVLFGLIVLIANLFSSSSDFESTFSENVLADVMGKYGITEREKFLATLPDFDKDENGYFKRSEIEEAAKAFTKSES